MEVIKKGKKVIKNYTRRFECQECGSILKEDQRNMTFLGFLDGDKLFEYKCPVCGNWQQVRESDFLVMI